MDEAQDIGPQIADAAPLRVTFIPIIVAASAFTVGLSSTSIITALPQIAQGVHRPALALSTLVTSYMLGLAIFIPASGWFAGRFGLRVGFAIASAACIVGSVVSGVTDHLPVMIAGRIIQAFGSSMLGPLGQMVLFTAFPRSKLVRVTGYTVMASQVGPLVAPFVGAYIVAWLDWRWVFFANIPLVLAVLAAATAAFRSVDIKVPRKPFDLVGFGLLAAGLCAMNLGVAALSKDHAATAAAMAVGVLAAAVAYVFWSRRAKHPILDLGLLGVRVYSVATFAGGFSISAIATMAFVLPLYFQIGLKMSPIQAANHLIFVTLGIIAFRNLLPAALRRLGFRKLLMLNGAALGLGVAAFALTGGGEPAWLLSGYLFAFGGLRSFHWSNINALGLSELRDEQIGHAAPMNGVANQVAQCLGVGAATCALNVLSGGGEPSADHFRLVFVATGALTLASVLGFLVLRDSDGFAASNYQRRAAR